MNLTVEKRAQNYRVGEVRQQQPRRKRSTLADHYKVLGVARDATQIEIRAAFLSQIRHAHPDKSQSPSDTAAQLIQAFEVLGDSVSRQVYDSCLDKTSEAICISRKTIFGAQRFA